MKSNGFLSVVSGSASLIIIVNIIFSRFIQLFDIFKLENGDVFNVRGKFNSVLF